MCTPQIYSQMQSGNKKINKNSMGSRLDQAQRMASASAGGGTYNGNSYGGNTILTGTPANTGVDALRKTIGVEV
jgi:hypothetical protein